MRKIIFQILLISVFVAVANIASAIDDTASVSYKKKKYEYRANKRYKEGKYEECFQNYRILMRLDSNKYQYYLDAGMLAYTDLNAPERAYTVLKSALKRSPFDTITDLVNSLARSAHFLSRYKEAKFYYRMYNRITNPKDRPERHNVYIDKAIKDCDYAMAHNVENDTIILENLGGTVNTKYPEYNPVVDSKDSVLYYTSRRPENNNGMLDANDNKYFEDVYESTNSKLGFTQPQKFEILEYVTSNKNFNPNLVHKSIVGMSHDEKELFMFKENKLWYSTKKDNGKWDTPSLMDYINVTKYQSHTALSPDRKTMYLAAEATNIIGNRDIQVSHLKDDGNWEIPSSISDSINTLFEENSPTICSDGITMYFSSQGLPGYGGYDIYKSTFKNGHWTTPINMGLPINSPGDDIYFNDNANDGIAYFSSHRLGGYGDQDIYKIMPLRESYTEFFPTSKNVNSDDKKLNNELEHSDETNIEILGPDTIFEGQRIKLDATNCNIINTPITKRKWKLSDGKTINDSLVIHRNYNKVGIYPERYFVSGNNKITKEQLGYFCTKNVVVLNILDYNTIIARREKQKQDGLIKRANDSLAAISKFNNKEIDKDFIKNAVANKGKDLNVSLNEGYDASKTKLDTTNLPNVSLNPIYFDLDKFAIRKDASKIMEKNIEIMKQYPDFVFKVSGFTDVRGGYEYNVILSKKRALAAISYLVKNEIPENRITGILSMGEKTAGFKDDTKTGLKEKEYQSDRRVEFSVLGKIIK